MALYKEIRQENGVRTDYHRILYLQKTVNEHNIIALLSYTDEEAREFEKTDGTIPYRKVVTYYTEYNPDMTVEDAYEYIKALPDFVGAQDI